MEDEAGVSYRKEAKHPCYAHKDKNSEGSLDLQKSLAAGCRVSGIRWTCCKFIHDEEKCDGVDEHYKHDRSHKRSEECCVSNATTATKGREKKKGKNEQLNINRDIFVTVVIRPSISMMTIMAIWFYQTS